MCEEIPKDLGPDEGLDGSSNLVWIAHVSRVPGVCQKSQLTGCGAQDDETRPMVLDESTHDEVVEVPIKILFLCCSKPGEVSLRMALPDTCFSWSNRIPLPTQLSRVVLGGNSTDRPAVGVVKRKSERQRGIIR